MKKSHILKITASVLFAMIFVVFCSCEDADDNNEAGSFLEGVVDSGETDASTQSSALAVTPGTATLDADGESVALSVEGGKTPYSWSVDDIVLGSVISSGTDTAVYQRGSIGDNVVIVTDKSGNEAYCVVTQQ